MTTRVERVHAPDRFVTCRRPLFLMPVSAGFPSPADDYLEGKLDLNQHLIKHPEATFFVRVTGDSMIDAGIHSGDLLIVDRALEPSHKSVVVAVINGELTVKRLYTRNGKVCLVPDNAQYPSLPIHEAITFEIWGVVTAVIHPV